MAKSLNDILKGVRKSKIAPPDITDKNLYQWNAPDGVKFIDKHKIEKHEDRVGNGDDVYQGSTKHTTKYKFQKDGVYESATCNQTEEGVNCPVHEKAACPTEDDVNMQPKSKKDAKGRQYLADKKKCMEETITEKKNLKDLFKAASLAGALAASAHRMPGVAYDVASNVHHKDPGYAIGTVAANMHPASRVANALTTVLKADSANKGEDEKARQQKYGKQLRAVVKEGRIEDDAQRRAAKELSKIAQSSNVPVTKLKPGKKDYNKLKSTGQLFGGARSFAAGLAKRNIEAGDEKSGYVGRAKVGGKLKEETVNEVAPPDPKIEKWIKSNKERFVKEYGKEKGMRILYAKAWKMHGHTESGTSNPATNTDYVGGGAAGYTTGRVDIGTL